MPEFGLTANTESSRYGPTRNPWDTDRSAGGSSGGSAAMVAAGVVPMAHANDGGGSIRIPASCCGLVGLKPSRGRLPMNPLKERIPVRIAAQGVVTRSVRDTALLLALTDPARPDAGLPPIGHVTRPGTERLRIGMCVSTLRGLPLSPDTVAAVRRAGALFEDLGHHVEEVGPPVGEEFATDFLRYWALLAFVLHHSGSAAYGKGFDGAQVEEFTRGLSKMLNRQIDRVPGSIRRLRQLSRNPDAGFEKYDLFLSPGHGIPGSAHRLPGPRCRVPHAPRAPDPVRLDDTGAERVRRPGDVPSAGPLRRGPPDRRAPGRTVRPRATAAGGRPRAGAGSTVAGPDDTLRRPEWGRRHRQGLRRA